MNSSSRSFFPGNQLISGRKKDRRLFWIGLTKKSKKSWATLKPLDFPKTRRKNWPEWLKKRRMNYYPGKRNKQKAFNPVLLPKKYGILKIMKSNRR